uniref:Putative juvenile hormone acid methyl transferase n=1 Tax=Nyssomyia neivai TaxID=330878 RepID=A0A1L8DNC6_9DIPT
MSFEKAKEYKAGNQFIIKITKLLMDKFSVWINWRQDGQDSFLDIGSGPGNTVREVIFPHLPVNFSRLVVSDISPQMVKLQKEEFADNNRISCEVLDIVSDFGENVRKILGTFDHITSFYCLMWIKDQQKVMNNIYSLLKPGGDCLLVIVADTPVLDTLISVCEKPKWKEYFIGWEDFYIFPYNKLNEAKDKGLEFMNKAGFVEMKAELVDNMIQFTNDVEKENFLRSMPNKFSKKVSAKDVEEIFQERLEVFDKFNLGDYRDNSGRINKPLTSLILYGRKN